MVLYYRQMEGAFVVLKRILYFLICVGWQIGYFQATAPQNRSMKREQRKLLFRLLAGSTVSKMSRFSLSNQGIFFILFKIQDIMYAIFIETIFIFSASIFAYGQTSSGKTYTMSALTEYTVADIYDYIQRVKKNLFHFSCLDYRIRT